jgi:hypothetical protein
MKIFPNSAIKTALGAMTLFMSAFSSHAQVCDPPTTVNITNVQSTTATATWNASVDAPGYEYNWEVRTSGAANSGPTGLEASGSTENGVLTTNLADLDINTLYTFYVRFKCSESDPSAYISTTFTTGTLATPVTTPATNVLDDSFTANWNPVAGATNYLLDVSTFSNFIDPDMFDGDQSFLPGFHDFSTTSNSASITGLSPNTTYYYRVRAEGDGGTGHIITAYSNTTSRTTLGPQTTWITWNGSVWEPQSTGEPDPTKDAFINGNYVTGVHGSFSANTVTINNGFTLTISPETNVTAVNAIVNQNPNNTGLIVQSNGFLVQEHSNADNPNIGGATVQRTSSPLYRLDYTMWSSPTADSAPVAGGQTLRQFSPETSLNRFYGYDSAANNFTMISPDSQFISGEGYLIRVRNTHPSFVNSSTPGTTWTGSFRGVPQSGAVSVALDDSGNGFNMVGNPYPSLLGADSFLAANEDNIEGTLYFWRRRNNDTGSTVEATSAYYATYTNAGGVDVPEATPSATSETPIPYIQVGQGFLVQAKPGAGDLVFTNAMRYGDIFDDVFFRGASQKNRIWLNVADATTIYNQTLIAYMDGATNDLDRADGKYINDGTVALTSFLNNSEYVIQGRAPFIATDVVAMNFKTPVAGNYTISIDHVDGLFTGAQDIFLEDKFLNITHDLKAGAYTFATDAGSFNNRFDVIYQNNLATDNPVLAANGVVVYKQNGDIIINAGSSTIASVKVFDIRGRLIAERNDVNASETNINAGAEKQVLVVQVTSTDNVTVSKKVVN